MHTKLKKQNTFAYLPLEIIVQIVNNLELKDIKSACLVSRHWHEAFDHPIIQQKFYCVLSVAKLNLTAGDPQVIRTLLNPINRYTELHITTDNQCLDKTDITRLIANTNCEIFKKVKYFTIKQSKLNFNNLSLLLSKMKKLIKLSVISCDLENSEVLCLKRCAGVLRQLKVFQMKSTNVGSYEKLLSFFRLTSQLGEFDIDCTINQNKAESITQTTLLSEIVLRNAITLQKISLKTYEN